MDRLEATKRFIHRLDFFESLSKKLKDNTTFLFAYYKNKPIASLLLLHNKNFVHNFLSCSYKDYLKLHANDLLKYYGIMWAKENNLKGYNLGGGLADNDDLYKYKASFSSLTTSRCIYKRIFNKKIYSELVELKKQSKEYNPNFFPEYRDESSI